MDYIISEDRLVRLVDKYITSTIGDLTLKGSSNIHATNQDFELVDQNRKLMFEFIDGHLGISHELFFMIMSMFNLTRTQTEDMFVKWFERRFPYERIVDSYYSIYY